MKIPLQKLDHNENDERMSLEVEFVRINKMLTKTIYEKEIAQARILLFIHNLKRRYGLTDTLITLEGDTIYQIDAEDLP